MINDGLALARGDVLCYSRTGRFADAAHYVRYRVLTHPVSLGCALQGGHGAAYVYVLAPKIRKKTGCTCACICRKPFIAA